MGDERLAWYRGDGMNTRLGGWLWTAIWLAATLAVAAKETPTPPGPPESGPGSCSNYPHAAVTKSVYGEGDLQYWLFEPAAPVPNSAPVIVLNHGWSGMNPRIYGAWIEHLARRGNIVIFPRYQASLKTPTRDLTPNAIQAVKLALLELQKGRHVRPELDKFAVVGHSAGGQITANMAALARGEGLPQPRAAMCVQPGKSWTLSDRIKIPLEELSRVPAETLLLCVVGEDDRVARDIDAKKIFYGTTQVPLQNKDFVILRSDDHGEPPLKATHFAPVAPDPGYDSGEKKEEGERGGGAFSKIRERRSHGGEDYLDLTGGANGVDALDTWGLWKLFDALCDAAFFGRNRAFALGNTPEQRSMGRWSDGRPVNELEVTDRP